MDERSNYWYQWSRLEILDISSSELVYDYLFGIHDRLTASVNVTLIVVFKALEYVGEKCISNAMLNVTA